MEELFKMNNETKKIQKIVNITSAIIAIYTGIMQLEKAIREK